MKLRKIISGGQTGADVTGLECARALGLETGGTAPKDYRTDEGQNLALRDLYGLVEWPTSDYQPRTAANVRDSDITIWFGKTGSPGYWCTENATRKYEKGFPKNPGPAEIQYLARTFEVINIAGNRRRINPDVVPLVQRAFGYIALVQFEGLSNERNRQAPEQSESDSSGPDPDII